MGDVFESTVPQKEYLGKISDLEFGQYQLEEEVKKLKLTLVKIKTQITDIQFYEPSDYQLDKIVESINEILDSK